MIGILLEVCCLILLLQGCASHANAPPFYIDEVTPTTGQPETIVTIRGDGFASHPEGNLVTFNGVSAHVLEATQTELKVLAPEGASRGMVEVSVQDETVQGPEFRFYNLYAYGSNFGTATYWRNGTETQISAPNSAITDMAISGSDVYASGWQMDGIYKTPECWKNGILKPLRGFDIATTTAIAVSDTNFHVVGSASSSSGTALYWAQGEAQILYTYHSSGADVAIHNSDIHILAFEHSESVYLVNGVEVKRLTGIGDGMVNIVIQDDIVHIAGVRENHLAYWRDGVEQIYSDESVRVSGLCVFGDNIYISGAIIEENILKARYWKNGAAIIPPGKQESSYAIVEITDDANYILVNDNERSALYRNEEEITPDLGSTTDDRINGIMIDYY